MRTVLVTGFGAFPGAPRNPTQELMARLQRHKARFARLGVRLETRVLPVVFSDISQHLAQLERELCPDAILHFGLATRRRWISLETRGVNRVTTFFGDASGRLSKQTRIDGGPVFSRSTLPLPQIVARLGTLHQNIRLSRDAGRYLCNKTFYLSLTQSKAKAIGFIHVPPLKHVKGGAIGLEACALTMILASLPSTLSKVDERGVAP